MMIHHIISYISPSVYIHDDDDKYRIPILAVVIGNVLNIINEFPSN